MPIQAEAHSCPAETVISPRASEPKGEASDPSHAIPVNAIPVNAAPELSNDYELFARAVQNTYAQPRYVTLSRATLQSQHQGQRITHKLRSQIVTAAQGYYRAELSFEGGNGMSNDQFLVISDGLKTWILDRRRNQYSITTHRLRLSPFEDTTLGLFAPFVLNMQQIALPELPSLAAMDRKKLAEQLKVVVDDTPDLTLTSTRVGEQPYQKIKIGNADLGTVTAFVDPQSAQIQCVELAIAFQGVNVHIQEYILMRKVLPERPDETFQFIPPEGSIQKRRVKILPGRR